MASRSVAAAANRSRILTTGFLFVVSVYFLLPVWWLLVSATKDNGDLFTSNGFWFAHFDLFGNLSQLLSFDNGEYVRWVLNTVLYAGLGAAASTLVSTAAGYVLAKYTFRGREAVFNTVLASILIPPALLALPLYLMFTKIHLVNTIWAVFLPSIVSPFGVYLSRVYAAAAMPDELLDAGRVDGASDARIFITVATRIMSPAMVTVFLFQFVAIWNNYLLPQVMLQNDKLWPITVGLNYWNGLHNDPQYVRFAIVGAAASVVPLMIAFLSLQRFWRSGLTAGAVK